jgi:hypothetical protein
VVGGDSYYKEVASNGREIARNLSMSVFKASMSWCRKDLPEWNSNEVTQWLPKEYHETLLSFQYHIIRLREEHPYSTFDW